MQKPPKIFDSHAHAFPDSIAPSALRHLIDEALWRPIQAYHDGTLKGLLDSMDRAGISRAVVCSVATKPTQVRKITDWSAAIASDRITPFASIHPDFDQPEAEVERIAQLGLRGLKIHPQYMNCGFDDPRMIRIAKAAAKANLCFTMHCGHDLGFQKSDLGNPLSLRRLHEAVPDLRILACHFGGWEWWDEVVKHVAGLPVWIETSFVIGQCSRELVERILEIHPKEYLLFGTDSPWADQKAEVEAFLSLPLDEPIKRAAMWDNMLRYLGQW